MAQGMTDQELEVKVQNLLISKSHLLVTLIVFLIPMIGFFYKIEYDISIIKNNHEAHMQTALEKIAELEATDKDQNARLEQQNNNIIKLLAIYEK